MAWSHFRHGADIGLRGTGASKEQAFQQIAVALTAAVTDVSRVAAREAFQVSCRAPDDEILLVDWLNSLIYEMSVRNMLLCEFDVSISDGELRAQVRGEAVDRSRHRPAVEVKGATFTALSVRRSGKQWIAECVVDV